MTLPTSIITALRTFIATCPNLETGALLLVDHLGETPVQYAIIPSAGNKVVEEYLDGSKLCEYQFLFRSMESTASDLERIETSGFYEDLSDWLDEQTELGNLPTLPEGKEAESIEATSFGYLYQESQSSTGIYQISGKLSYIQAP